MIPTAPSDELDDFLRFLSLCVGDAAVRSARGASADEISRFQALARFPLPALYLGYLRTFGQDDPVLQMADDACPAIDALIEVYELPPGLTRRAIPPNGVLIADEGISGGRSLIYKTPDGGAEPRVAVTWSGAAHHFTARSFRNHLYTQAFLRGRIRDDVPSNCLSRRGARVLPDAVRVAAGLGFEPYWFSDEFRVSLERQDGARMLIVDRGDTLVYTTAKDPSSRDEVADRFARELEFRTEWSK